MIGRGDERGVTVQIGAVLLLAILFSALALYQVNAVPAENEVVEINHNERVQGDLQDLRNAIQNGGTEGRSQSTSVTLGTQYPTRTILMNPMDPQGTLETTGPSEMTVENAAVLEPAGQFERDGEQMSAGALTDEITGSHETTTVRYEPGYNEYRNHPTTRIESGFAFNEFDDAAIGLTGQPVIDGDRISLVLVDGDLSKTGRGTTSVDTRAVSGPSDPIDVESDGDPITLTIPTDVPEAWVDRVGTEFGSESHEPNARILDPDPDDDEVTIELEDDRTYQLQLARVSVDQGTSSDTEFDIVERDESGAGGDGGRAFQTWWNATGTQTHNADANPQCSPGDVLECSFEITSSDEVTLVADTPAETAFVDYAVGTGSAVEEIDPETGTTDSGGTNRTNVSVGLNPGETTEFSAFVTSGGDGDEMLVSVERLSEFLQYNPPATASGDENSVLEFELESLAEEPLTIDGISFESTDSDATRINNPAGWFSDGNEVTITGSQEGSLDTGSGTDSSIAFDGTMEPLDDDAVIGPGDTAEATIGNFREEEAFSTVDMTGQQVTVTLYFRTESNDSLEQQFIVSVPSDDDNTAGEPASSMAANVQELRGSGAEGDTGFVQFGLENTHDDAVVIDTVRIETDVSPLTNGVDNHNSPELSIDSSPERGLLHRGPQNQVETAHQYDFEDDSQAAWGQYSQFESGTTASVDIGAFDTADSEDGFERVEVVDAPTDVEGDLIDIRLGFADGSERTIHLDVDQA